MCNSWRPCLRAQQRERLVIGDSKQCQVPLHRSSLASFLQKDAVSNNGSVWPLVLRAPWIFGRGWRAKKCLRLQCRRALQLLLKSNLVDCVRLIKHVLIQFPLFSLVYSSRWWGTNFSRWEFFFLWFSFLNAGDFPVRMHVCELRFHRQDCNLHIASLIMVSSRRDCIICQCGLLETCLNLLWRNQGIVVSVRHKRLLQPDCVLQPQRYSSWEFLKDSCALIL